MSVKPMIRFWPSVKLLLAAWLLAPAMANGQALTPESFEATIDVGESVTVVKTVTTPVTGADMVDVFFLADNTGSMGGILNSVKSFAGDLLSELDLSIGDVAFGVGRYLGDPREFGVASPATAQAAYTLQQAISTDNTASQTAINAWFASGGGDLPEANFFALQQVATSGAATDGLGSTDVPGVLATGYDTGWREGSIKVIVWFGDAISHDTTVDLAEAIAALTGENIVVAAINTQGAGGGIDASGQASAIVAATGGTLTNNVSGADATATKDAILAAIGAATSTFDLSLFTVGDTSGLDIDFTCTSAEGCTGVTGGESRTFDMTITGLAPGVYDFETRVTGISGAVEDDLITVRGDVPPPSTVPTPTPLPLFGAGLLALAYLQRRRSL